MKRNIVFVILFVFSINIFSQLRIISDGSPVLKGHVYLYANEGENSSGTAYLQARDFSGSSSIGLQFRTQNSGSIINALKINSDGKIGIGTNPGSQKLRINGSMSITGFQSGSDLIIDGSGYPPSCPSCVSWVRIYAEDGNGSIGALNNPFYEGYFTTLRVNGVNVNSDIRYKENIKSISEALDKIMKLEPIQYDYKKEYLKIKHKDSIQIPEFEMNFLKDRIGFSAQDVKLHIPEVVREDENGYYSINYIELIPLLTSAIQQQQQQISTLQNIATEHEKEILALKEQLAKLDEKNLKSAELVTDGINGDDLTALYQNAPNPFSQDTEIRFFIPDEISNSKIYIHNLNGGQIKAYEISERGNCSLQIKGSELEKGMYTYTLVADGAIVDTKRMILTD